MLRVRLDRFPPVLRALSVRAVVLMVFGGIAAIGGAFGIFLGSLLVIVPEGGIWEARSGIVVGVFFGAIPFAGGALAIWRGIVNQIRVQRLRALVAHAGQLPGFEVHDLPAALQLAPRVAELLVADAAGKGLLEQIAGQASTAPPPRLPALPAFVPQAWVGQVLGGTYEVEELIGVGGMGAVYAGHNVRTRRRYAIKTLLPDAEVTPEVLRRFEREALAASSLGHPNIVAVHDFNVTPEGIHYMVMDLLDGEPLDRRLERVGVLPWREAIARALELVSALGAAHAAGLLHRDLKPANIFLARATDATGSAVDRAVLLDFGVVKELAQETASSKSRLTATGQPIGTPLYMSPEQARGEPLDVRSDVYGLAAVLFEMLTGTPPFFDPTLAAVYAKLLTMPPPRASALAPSGLPPALDAVLAQALAKRPEERFFDMASFGRALASAT